VAYATALGPQRRTSSRAYAPEFDAALVFSGQQLPVVCNRHTVIFKGDADRYLYPLIYYTHKYSVPF
jgi:hypothetical protein